MCERDSPCTHTQCYLTVVLMLHVVMTSLKAGIAVKSVAKNNLKRAVLNRVYRSYRLSSEHK